MTDKVRVGVVGAGWWSSYAHLPAIAENPLARLVCISDSDRGRAKTAAELFGARYAVGTVPELIESGVDAAVVATPQNSHYQAAVELIDAGIHVLVEKPMTINPHEAWDLVRRAEARGVHLQVGHTFPHDPLVGHLREAYLDGDLGEPVSVAALFATAVAPFYKGETEFAQHNTGAPFASRKDTYSNAAGGGQLYTQLSHAVALVLKVTDDSVSTVNSFEQRLDLDVDIADAVSARLTEGGIATFHSTGSVLDNETRVEEYRFFGTKGHALLDTVRGTLELSVPQEQHDQSLIRGDDFDLVRAPVKNLIATVRGDEESVVTGELGARVIDMLAAARESSLTGCAAKVQK